MAFSAPGRAGRYGLDAPHVPFGIGATGIAFLAFAALGACRGSPAVVIAWFAAWGVIALLGFWSFLYTTRRGKFLVWRELIDGLALAGNERVLDLGCGRGLVVLEAARQLPQGEAVGLDLWRRADQTGNERAAAEANARAEDVAARVRFETGDMRALPFSDASFDVVLSSLALHNIPSAEGRRTAVAEAVRVLRPGGRLLLADFRHARAHAAQLRQLGLVEVERRGLGWRYWYGGPFWATALVSARKPVGAGS